MSSTPSSWVRFSSASSFCLPAGKRRRGLERRFQEGVAQIAFWSWDAGTGLCWARLLADLRITGRSMPIKDSLIAGTAMAHGLTVVTRNVQDFRKTRVKVLNPFA